MKCKKLKFYEFVNKYKYYAFAKTRKEINGTIYNGYIYKLCEKLTNTQINELQTTYNNILIYHGCYEYAPEIKFDALFIAHSKSKLKNLVCV